MTIRFAEPSDSPKLRAIYAQYIDTPASFERALPSEREFAGRIAAISEWYPYLVCEEAGEIIGYAYAHRQMEREAYQWNAELSVYLDRTCTARGLGSALCRTLIELLRLQGIKTVYGGVTLPNSKSEGLHRSLGFGVAGTYHRTGFKAGAWHDVRWFEKQIADYDDNPAAPIPVGELPAETVRGILDGAGRGL